ncbi:TetR/AcrR family transcriptional regulator [Streptomyces sp. NRRL B-24484]|uniref:TetR/AcrR family transcriptional regulator n=1 Tax=Streptomyces sp. NRRL B-24484 TaxID=1463833 RepID=UPI0004BE55C7|nr:TetR/AcrR family transcriptional regulator [Streptomyces sp. NRRL B-24484]
MPRPRSLTTRQIAVAALAVIDREGLAALSMRTVAAELDRRTMALYRYVEDREELECLVAELVLSPVLDRLDAARGGGTPRERIVSLAELVHAAVAAHPGALPLAVKHRAACMPALRWAESVLGVLAETGLDAADRPPALRAVAAHLIGALELEHGPGAAEGGRSAAAALPRDAFPLLVQAAEEGGRPTADRSFRVGLDALLAGLGIA